LFLFFHSYLGPRYAEKPSIFDANNVEVVE